LLGHLNIQTTRGYVAVFDDDVVRHYQEFLDRRRAQRPEGEYRTPSKTEWNEFNEHFDKRRVELGSCGRPYGTPCTHEHACIRCPMLSINPKMLPRLDELEEDLIARRQRAVDEDWRGEIDGLDRGRSTDSTSPSPSCAANANRPDGSNGPAPSRWACPFCLAHEMAGERWQRPEKRVQHWRPRVFGCRVFLCA
jgi:hypothetical protein